jgi:uncharacterized protein (TIGR03083 family)
VTAADRGIGALRDSSRRLRHAVADLPPGRLAEASFAEGWTVGQVLSHLGSGAEISTALVERGLKGDERGPVREELVPVWERWDAMSPVEQRAAWLEADERHLALLDSVDAGQRTSLRVPYFAGLLDLASYAGYRLSEQAVHAWDVMVALDERAVLDAADVVLLWERIDLVATRFRNADALTRLAPRRVQVQLTDPRRTLLLDIDTELHLYPTPPADPTARLTGPAESVLRLIYGRNRPQDPLTATGSITLDDLRTLFPGF